MNYLFDLYIYLIENECGRHYEAYYHIGTFRTKDEADAAAKTLMSNGGRFSADECKAKVQEVELVGNTENIDCVYRFYGQSFDPDLENDAVFSPYYADRSAATADYISAKKNTPRQKWNMTTHMIGKYNLC